ncbi:MAG: NlpC/P60 family protein [Pseudomonadota bacterium]|nr:NlpC/P60 family protein [Pseudomonadota bacterium]
MNEAKLDPRIHAYRADLADGTLRALIEAPRYVEPVMRQCVRGVVPVLAEPKPNAKQVSQIRYGEFLDVFETRDDGFAWVQNRIDRYVGYALSEGVFSDTIADLSFRINALRTFVYPEPDMKSPPIDELTLGAFVQPGERHGEFVGLPSGGYVFAGHILPAAESLTPDYVFTAGRLLASPYLWGGRTPKGIDCSGLVQLALDMAGWDAPRDADQQREAFGRPLEGHWRDIGWQRGDLVFFPGHVGLMTGPDHIIHANPQTMGVTVEPLFDLAIRRRDVLAMGRLN